MSTAHHSMPPGESLSGTPSTPLLSAEFRAVMGQFASGVTIVSTRIDGDDFGTTASAFTSLSLEPPMVLACLYRGAATEVAIRESGRFGINILRDDQQAVAERFASRHPDRFSSIAHRYGAHGVPLIEGALAHVECKVTETVIGGTHTVFLGTAQTAKRYEGRPLAYFGGAFGHFLLGDDAAVQKAIRSMLIGNDLPPGSVLSIPELAEDLETDPGVVLAALKRLASERRVVREPDGTYIAGGLDERTALDMISACRTVEVGVAELTVGWVDDAEIDELERLARLPCEALPALPSEGSERPAVGFHEHLVGLSRNSRLLEHYREMSTATVFAASDADGHERASADHQAIADGYRNNDLPAVIAAIDRHARRLREAWVQVMAV